MSIRIVPWKDGKWQVDMRGSLPDGTRLRKREVSPVTGKDATKRWAERRLAALLSEIRPAQAKKEAPTLAEFWPRFDEGYMQANQRKPTTLRTYRSIYRVHLEPVLGAKRLDEIGDEALATLRLRLKSHAPKTVNNVVLVLSVMLGAAVQWNVIARKGCNPEMLKTQRPDLEFYEPDVFEALVVAAREHSPDAEVIVLLGGEAGLRVGEMIALEWSDVDWKRGELVVSKNETVRGAVTTTKGNRVRRVEMTQRLAKALTAYRHLRGPRVFYQRNGKHAEWWWMRDQIEAPRTKIPPTKTEGLHILRHTFCSRLAMAGVPIHQIKELAGHRTIEQTLRYMHLAPNSKRLAIAALERGNIEATGKKEPGSLGKKPGGAAT